MKMFLRAVWMNVASLPHLCLAGVLSPGTLLAQLSHGDVWCALDGCCPAVCFRVSIQPTAKCSGAAAVPSSPCSALVCSPKLCFRLGPGSGVWLQRRRLRLHLPLRAGAWKVSVHNPLKKKDTEPVWCSPPDGCLVTQAWCCLQVPAHATPMGSPHLLRNSAAPSPLSPVPFGAAGTGVTVPCPRAPKPLWIHTAGA